MQGLHAMNWVPIFFCRTCKTWRTCNVCRPCVLQRKRYEREGGILPCFFFEKLLEKLFFSKKFVLNFVEKNRDLKMVGGRGNQAPPPTNFDFLRKIWVWASRILWAETYNHWPIFYQFFPDMYFLTLFNTLLKNEKG